ncbi:MAG: ATP synthase F0 subunit B [Myxococcales bacterium]|nr:ATP synthase F0 subunit B [Myxococcales bacterium]
MRRGLGSALGAVLLSCVVGARVVGAQDPHAAASGHPAHANQSGGSQAGPDTPHDAHGAHGAPTLGELFSSTTFLGAIVNFSLLVTLFVVFGRKPLRAFLERRRAQVAEALEEARRLREQIETRERQMRERLARLDAEIEQIRTEMRRAGEAERDRIVAEAEAKAARLRKEAEFLIEQQFRQLRVDALREASMAAVAAAERVLRERVTAADQERLARQYLERLRGLVTEGTEGRREAAGVGPDRAEPTVRADGAAS